MRSILLALILAAIPVTCPAETIDNFTCNYTLSTIDYVDTFQLVDGERSRSNFNLVNHLEYDGVVLNGKLNSDVSVFFATNTSTDIRGNLTVSSGMSFTLQVADDLYDAGSTNA